MGACFFARFPNQMNAPILGVVFQRAQTVLRRSSNILLRQAFGGWFAGHS